MQGEPTRRRLGLVPGAAPRRAWRLLLGLTVLLVVCGSLETLAPATAQASARPERATASTRSSVPSSTLGSTWGSTLSTSLGSTLGSTLGSSLAAASAKPHRHKHRPHPGLVASRTHRIRHDRFRAHVTVVRHATVRVETRVQVREKASAKAHSRARRHGKPIAVGHARTSAWAQARAAAHSRARGEGTGVATARTRRAARQWAFRRAVAAAEEHAHHKARQHALVKARKRAARRAHPLAAAKAHRKARRLAEQRTILPSEPLTWRVWAPDDYTPRAGPMFNNPYGNVRSRRALLNQVIRAINSSPGYHRPYDRKHHRWAPCPANPAYWPSTIRIASYSISDMDFADAIAHANRRCVSVQVLMNSHLTTVTSPAYGEIQHRLGRRSSDYVHQRSFAHRCSNGCLGTSVMHLKTFLFSHAGQARDTVMTGSTNMTGNAVHVQWNDLYTVNNDSRLYSQFDHQFDKMRNDRPERGPWKYHAGPYWSMFWPFRAESSHNDPTLKQLQSISCTGAKAPAGARGHTVVYIAMYAWFESRGRYLARQVRRMHDEGCRVRILYSFMSHKVYQILTHGKGLKPRRMSFSQPDGIHAAKYSHLKLFAASGKVAGRRTTWVTWTGSNNWTNKDHHSDEVTLRITSRQVYLTYMRRWKFMRQHHSAPNWAMYEEPQGGGRAP